MLRESVAGEEVLERAAEAAEFERLRARTERDRARPDRVGHDPGLAAADGARAGSRAASGSRSPGTAPGFTGSGEVKLASVVSLELTGRGRASGS